MKKLLLVLGSVLGMLGCEHTQDKKAEVPFNAMTVPPPEICESIDEEELCRDMGCAWTLAKMGWLVDGVCMMNDSLLHRCLSIVQVTHMNMISYYYREAEYGYTIIELDYEGDHILGWKPCVDYPLYGNSNCNCL